MQPPRCRVCRGQVVRGLSPQGASRRFYLRVDDDALALDNAVAAAQTVLRTPPSESPGCVGASQTGSTGTCARWRHLRGGPTCSRRPRSRPRCAPSPSARRSSCRGAAVTPCASVPRRGRLISRCALETAGSKAPPAPRLAARFGAKRQSAAPRKVAVALRVGSRFGPQSGNRRRVIVLEGHARTGRAYGFQEPPTQGEAAD